MPPSPGGDDGSPSAAYWRVLVMVPDCGVDPVIGDDMVPPFDIVASDGLSAPLGLVEDERGVVEGVVERGLVERGVVARSRRLVRWRVAGVVVVASVPDMVEPPGWSRPPVDVPD